MAASTLSLAKSLQAYFPNTTLTVGSIDSRVTGICDIRFCFLEVFVFRGEEVQGSNRSSFLILLLFA